MTGYVFAVAPCVVCQQRFFFSAERVPSVVVRGERRPICSGCVEVVNPLRVANGLEPIVVLPGAYKPDEAGAL
jgi:hypothetical protein